MGRDFRAQPWHQLIRVFQRMGLPAAARDVAVAREVQLRRVGRVGAGAPLRLRWLPRLAHRAFGLLAGYGHRPWRPAVAMLLVWLGCAAIYDLAAERGAIAPTTPWQSQDRMSACAAKAAKRPIGRGAQTCLRSTRRSTRCRIRSNTWCRSSICSSAVCGRWPANARHPMVRARPHAS